jgi:hypothetical protein
MFKKYQHVALWKSPECDTLNPTHSFYKLDGANASIWVEDGIFKCASRTVELSASNTLNGFYNIIKELPENFKEWIITNNYRVYGEWLISHSVQTYKNSAWKKFYIFDVVLNVNIGNEHAVYIPYEQYRNELEAIGISTENNLINYIPEIKDCSTDWLLDKEKYPEAFHEGIIFKDYNYVSRFGHRVWGKDINAFYKNHTRHEKVRLELSHEEHFLELFLNQHLIEKEYYKLSYDDMKPQELLGRMIVNVYQSLITDHIFDYVESNRKYNPVIDFGKLKALVVIPLQDFLVEKNEGFSIWTKERHQS